MPPRLSAAWPGATAARRQRTSGAPWPPAATSRARRSARPARRSARRSTPAGRPAAYPRTCPPRPSGTASVRGWRSARGGRARLRPGRELRERLPDQGVEPARVEDVAGRADLRRSSSSSGVLATRAAASYFVTVELDVRHRHVDRVERRARHQPGDPHSPSASRRLAAEPRRAPRRRSRPRAASRSRPCMSPAAASAAARPRAARRSPLDDPRRPVAQLRVGRARRPSGCRRPCRAAPSSAC